MTKISDYQLAYPIIQTACKATSCKFVDLNVRLMEEGEAKAELRGSELWVGPLSDYITTTKLILAAYFANFNQICGANLFTSKEQENQTWFLVSRFLNTLRQDAIKIQEPFAMRLYQSRFVWLLMKDIISPVFDKTTKNLKLYLMSSPTLGVSEILDKDDESVIFLNADIGYKPCVDAFLLKNVLKAHSLDPLEVANSIMGTFLNARVSGLAELEYKCPRKAQDFFVLFFVACGLFDQVQKVIETDGKLQSSNIKEAQMAGFGADTLSNWWMFGLIEKMLEPARGNRDFAHKNLEAVYQEIRAKLDKARKEKGRDGLSYEALIRFMFGENDNGDVKILEKVLGSDRVW